MHTATAATVLTLHWHEANNRPFQATFDPSRSTYTGPQIFTDSTEPTPQGVRSPDNFIRLDYETWQALGGPIQLRVTVEAVQP